MHGGIGMTDEFDIGLYMKRDRVLNELFGDSGLSCGPAGADEGLLSGPTRAHCHPRARRVRDNGKNHASRPLPVEGSG